MQKSHYFFSAYLRRYSVRSLLVTAGNAFFFTISQNPLCISQLFLVRDVIFLGKYSLPTPITFKYREHNYFKQALWGEIS